MIKNIIFDLGGVIYDIRYQNIVEKFASYGIPDFETYYTQANQTDVIDLFEEGKIPVEDFRAYIRSLSPIPLTDYQIDTAWNAILIDVPSARVEMLRNLKKYFHLFLFSNTNQLNYDQFMTDLQHKFGYDIFSELFEKDYFSHHIHYRKPCEEAFRYVLNAQNLIPEETLFIDDTIRHIEGAKKVGLNVYHLQKGEDILEKRWAAAFHLLT
ncbi:MAG: HAD family phosphatase [Bacteroidales bacterium]|nr:HAD family phosphatase [Bacteroidales bacterium]